MIILCRECVKDCPDKIKNILQGGTHFMLEKSVIQSS